jgi:hypothetical protein
MCQVYVVCMYVRRISAHTFVMMMQGARRLYMHANKQP